MPTSVVTGSHANDPEIVDAQNAVNALLGGAEKNVYAYGATGDGSTDDTAAFNAALLAGGTVIIPKGTFRLNSTVNIKVAGTRVIGTGGKIFVGFKDGTGGTLFSVSASNVSFDGVVFDATGATTGSASVNHYIIQALGTSGTHLTNISVSNCRFNNLPWTLYPVGGVGTPFATHAVYAQYVDALTVRDNYFETIGGAAIFMSVVTNAKIIDNTINNTQWYSIQFNDGCDQALVRGNWIGGTMSKCRLWGGSINLMSNGSTGAALGTGNATIKRVEICHNFITGSHSYTAAVHIESSSEISFHHNTMWGISLTQPSDFYANPTPPDYVRPYVRPASGSTNEGPNDHIDISDNLMIANGVQCIGIYADAQDNGSGTLAYSDTLVCRGNKIISVDSSNYWQHAIIVHGQQGGWKNLQIVDNVCTGFPDSSSPVVALIGTAANSTAPVTDVRIEGNILDCVGGAASTTTHLGIGADAYTQRVFLSHNIVKNFWDGIRTFTNASAITLGPNTFTGSGSADYLLGPAPSVSVGTVPFYGSQVLLTGRGSALGATNIVASAAAGEYRVSFNARTTTSGTGTTATVSIIWTDEGGAKTYTSATFALNAVDVTGQVNGVVFLHSAASQNIQVSVAGTFGTSAYAVSASAEKIN